jgi:predicted  nucleic acid-binding Zn-ribbon protein
MTESESTLAFIYQSIDSYRKSKEELKKEQQRILEQIQNIDIEIRNLRQQIPKLEKDIQEEKKKILLDKKEITDLTQAREILKQYSNEYQHAKEVYLKVTEARRTLAELGDTL